MSTMTNLQVVWSSYNSQIKAFKASPLVQRESSLVREQAASIKTVDDLIKNKTVFKYVLKAYGMDDLPYEAMIRKLLVEGTEDKKSFANSFVDQRYKTFVKEMGFGEGGSGHFSDAAWVDKLIEKYETIAFEENKGEADANVRLGLYFERNASKMTDWYSVLADKAMSEVVFTSLGLPDETRLSDIDKLASMLEKRIPISDLQDPKKVRAIVQRFAIFSDTENSIATNPVLQLFQGTSPNGGRTVIGFDQTMLAEISKLRYR